MRKILLALLLVATTAMADHHLLLQAERIPSGSQWAIGPWVWENCAPNPDCVAAVFGAQDAWDVTNAVGAINGWSGYVSQGDCPSYPFPPVSQIGAFNFATIEVCSALAKLSNPANVLAFVDYYDTKSISLNLAFAWYVGPGTPPPGVYDVQSVLGHEFGHALGLAHIPDPSGGSCDFEPNRPTMGPTFASGETCARTLNAHDVEHANLFYDNPAAQISDAQIVDYIEALIANAGSLDAAVRGIKNLLRAGIRVHTTKFEREKPKLPSVFTITWPVAGSVPAPWLQACAARPMPW